MIEGEPPAFLVEPVHHREVVYRNLALGSHPFGDFRGCVKCCQHPVGSVEAAAQRLGIQVRTEHHVGCARDEIDQGKHVADAVHTHLPSVPGGKFCEPVAAQLVLGRSGLAFNAVVVGGTEGCHVVEVGKEGCGAHGVAPSGKTVVREEKVPAGNQPIRRCVSGTLVSVKSRNTINAAAAM